MDDISLRQAIALLQDDTLVWSEDFESIRKPLGSLLEKIRKLPTHQMDDELDELIAIINCDHVPPYRDPMESWMNEAARQLGFFQMTANRSQRTAEAIRRMFRSL